MAQQPVLCIPNMLLYNPITVGHQHELSHDCISVHSSTALPPMIMSEWRRNHDLTLSARAEWQKSAANFFGVIPVDSQQEIIQQL